MQFIDVVDRYRAEVRNDLPIRSLIEIKRLVIHHVGVDAEVSTDRLLNSFKASGYGYHLYVRANGTVYQLVPWDQVAFHVGAGPTHPGGDFSQNNWESIGISLEGSFIEGRTPGDVQLNAVRSGIGQVFVDLGRSLPLVGHKDLAATQCPGDWWGPDAVTRLMPGDVDEVAQLKQEVDRLTVQVATLQKQADNLTAREAAYQKMLAEIIAVIEGASF
jgi:N-acetyl-anhydromuramyl-L-alanine amidase AmpD